MLKHIKISPNLLQARNDWRPAIYLSPGAVLLVLGEKWHSLGKLAKCIEGWRVSTNPMSHAYDARVENSPIIRLRNVESVSLHTDSEHWQTPVISNESFCVQPFDVLVRKVGSVSASLICKQHRQHPIDGNLAIIRGLSAIEGLWLTWCLNQPIYQSYLSSAQTMTQLVRVGLKQLVNMPLAPIPKDFTSIAMEYLEALSAYNQNLDALFQLRKSVSQWIENYFSDIYPLLKTTFEEHRLQWFKSADIADQWTITAAEQRHLSHRLQAEYLALPISEMADINPGQAVQSEVLSENAVKVLRIGDLNDHFDINLKLSEKNESNWRTHKRSLHQYDVLLSTFTLDNKVAFISDVPDETILPSEQLVTIFFHQHQGAYALLMESELIQSQWKRLATGSVQRFVQPSAVKWLIMPKLEEKQANRWHQQLIHILDKGKQATQRMAELSPEIQKIFEQQHTIEQKNIARNIGVNP